MNNSISRTENTAKTPMNTGVSCVVGAVMVAVAALAVSAGPVAAGRPVEGQENAGRSGAVTPVAPLSWEAVAPLSSPSTALEPFGEIVVEGAETLEVLDVRWAGIDGVFDTADDEELVVANRRAVIRAAGLYLVSATDLNGTEMVFAELDTTGGVEVVEL